MDTQGLYPEDAARVVDVALQATANRCFSPIASSSICGPHPNYTCSCRFLLGLPLAPRGVTRTFRQSVLASVSGLSFSRCRPLVFGLRCA